VQRGLQVGFGLALLMLGPSCAHVASIPRAPSLATPVPALPPVADRPQVEQPAAKTTPVPRPPGLRLRVKPADAILEVNGQTRGPVAGTRALETLRALPRGIHRVVLRREGYESWRCEVALPAQTLHVSLTPIPHSTLTHTRFHGAGP